MATKKTWRIAGRVYEEDERRFLEEAALIFANKSGMPCPIEESVNGGPYKIVKAVAPSCDHEKKVRKERKEARKVLEDAQTDFWNKEKFNAKRGET